MKTSRIVCAAAVLVVLGCHAPTRETHWQRTGEGAEPLDAARAECKAEALAKGSQTANEGLAAKESVGAFAECMRKRGWVLAEGPAH
jgi:hypothetical protein